jgi:hypothetical protein
MYPFERFTERAKKVLTLAQEEAERSHHSYIGTEHLLLGLMRMEEGLANKVLTALNVDLKTVRQLIESVLGREERIIIQQIIPTSRVKEVIEISFEEARRMGHNYVGTEHLLLGLLIEGEGIAAHVLHDLGVTIEKARAEIERQLQNAGADFPEAPARHRFRFGLIDQPPRTGAEALAELLVSPRLAALLVARGLDVDTLSRELLDAPEDVRDLRRQEAAVAAAINAAVEARNYAKAAELQEVHATIASKLDQAEQEWLENLAR